MKKAILNDGRPTINYSTIEELENLLMEPYSSLYPLEEYPTDKQKGLLLGKENVNIGEYEIIPDMVGDVTDLDNYEFK